MWFLIPLALGVIALAHAAPFPFLLDTLAGDRAVWHMPRGSPRTVYLTFDDGPNPTSTPGVLDVLAREDVRATFFLIEHHITDETTPILRRMFDEGHAVALHSASRRYLFGSPSELADTLTRWADRIAALGGTRPCRAFRPHAGWRSGTMYEALRRIDYRLIGWGWLLWDFNWFRPRTAEATARRLETRVRGGDIIVLHDGDESAPRRDQRQTVEAVARVIPILRARGFSFGTVCENEPDTRGPELQPGLERLPRKPS